jgi:hypothetical protein
MISLINCLQNSFIIVVRNRGTYSWEFGWFLFKHRIGDLIPEDLLPLREFRWLMIIPPYQIVFLLLHGEPILLRLQSLPDCTGELAEYLIFPLLSVLQFR